MRKVHIRPAEADEPPSSMNAVTFGRKLHPSLKISRVIGVLHGTSLCVERLVSRVT